MSVAQSASRPDLAPETSPDDALIATLAEEFGLSTAEELRLEELRAAIASRGVRPTDPAFARWLSPVFCSSPEEQGAFLARYEELAMQFTPRFAPTTVMRLTLAPLEPVRRPAPQQRVEIDETRGRNRRDAMVAGGLVFAGLLVLVLLAWLAGGDPLPLPGGGPPLAAPQVPKALWQGAIRVFDRWGFKLGVTAWALLGLIPIAIGLAIGLCLLLWRRRARGAFHPSPEASRPIALRAAIGDYFGEPDVMRAMLNLARHGRAPGARLHVRRSLRATIRNGGYPILRYGGRPKLPGYLLLVDCESRRDHLRLVADMLARRLRQQNAAVALHTFNRRPKTLVNLEQADRRLTSLAELAAELPEARVLVLAESDRLIAGDGRAADWLDDLAATHHVTVLDPRAEADWADDEIALRRAHLAVLPATPDGVRRYGDWIAVGGAGLPTAAPQGSAGLDLPFQLSRHRAMLLAGLPSPELLEGLVADLEAWLGPGLMRLLRALALFPRLEPELTLAIGKALKDAGGSPLLSDETLLRIIRLPWLRAGRMPDDLRGRLLRDLSRRDLQTTVHMVHAWLVSDPEVLRQESSRPPRRRGLLAAWLRAAADTDLHDPLLIDALDGRGPDRLGLRRSPVERLQRFVRDPALVSGAVALALAATVMWIQPLYVDMPMPRAAPAPNTDPGLDQASEASASKVDDGSAPTSTAPAPALAATSPSPLSSVVQAAPQTVPPQGNVPTGGAEGAQAARYRQAQIEGRRLLDSISPNDDASLVDVFDAVNDAMKRGDLDAVRKEAANWEQRLETEHFIDWSENRKSGLEAKEFFVYFPIEQAVVTPEIRQVVEEAAGYAKQGGGKLVVAPIYRGETPTIQKRRADLLVKALASAGVPSQAIVVGDTAPLAEPPRSGDGVREPLQRSFRIDVVFDR